MIVHISGKTLPTKKYNPISIEYFLFKIKQTKKGKIIPINICPIVGIITSPSPNNHN